MNQPKSELNLNDASREYDLMGYQLHPYHTVLIISAAITLMLAVKVWRARSVINAHLILIVLMLVALWITAQGLEHAAVSLASKIRWANVQYLAIMGAPPIYFFLAARHTGHDKLLGNRLLLAFLIGVPVLMNILLWTDEIHGLMRQNVFLDTSTVIPVVRKDFGPLFRPFIPYNFIVTGSTLFMLADALKRRQQLFYEQTVLLFLGLLLPFITTVIHLTGILPFRFDLTPAVFSISGLLISLGIFRYRLFDVVPVAHSLIIDRLHTGVIVFDAADRIADINPEAARLFRLPVKQLIGRRVGDALGRYPELLAIYAAKLNSTNDTYVIHDPGDSTGSVPVEGTDENESGREENGDIFLNGMPGFRPGAGFAADPLQPDNRNSASWYEISLSQLNGPRGIHFGWLMMAYDITERKQAEQMIRRIALHDSLTGVPNRGCFMELAAQQIRLADRRKEVLGFAFIDLDNFKDINDRFGHDFGDFVLRETADRIRKPLRRSDIVARIGGDEFAVLMPAVGSRNDALSIAEKIYESLRPKVVRGEQETLIQASIGISLFPEHGQSVDELLISSDMAMYEAKKLGKNRCIIAGCDPTTA